MHRASKVVVEISPLFEHGRSKMSIVAYCASNMNNPNHKYEVIDEVKFKLLTRS
jgi:hypothetical protein